MPGARPGKRCGKARRSRRALTLDDQRDRQVHFLGVDEPRQSEKDGGTKCQVLAQGNDAGKLAAHDGRCRLTISAIARCTSSESTSRASPRKTAAPNARCSPRETMRESSPLTTG